MDCEENSEVLLSDLGQRNFIFLPHQLKKERMKERKPKRNRMGKNCISLINQPKCIDYLELAFCSFPHPLFKPVEVVYFWKVLKVSRILNGKFGIFPTDILHKIVVYESRTVFQFLPNVRLLLIAFLKIRNRPE